MQPSRMTTLFAEAPLARRGPSAVLISVLAHVAAIGLGYVYMRQAVRVVDLTANQRYNVRLIQVEQPHRRTMRPAGSTGSPGEMAAPLMQTPGPGGRASSAFARQIVHAARADQVLVQPDLPPDLLQTKQIPLPQVLMWSPGRVEVTTITPPRLQVANTPVSRTSLETPNEQLKIAELKISANAFGPSALTLPPSTTTPVIVKRASAPVQMPATVSSPIGTATPARVISLSDTQLERGTIALPALNEAGARNGVNDPNAEKALAAGSGNEVTQQNASGSGNDKGGGSKEGTSAAGNGEVATTGTGGHGEGGHSSTGQGAGVGGTANDSGSGPDGGIDAGTVTEIRQPADGQFSAVVVGASISERYPETTQLWAGRLAYTVYLHVGREKNWILQYAVTREAASVGGNVAQPNAPWPYLMECPHLAPGDLNSDAVMVHGRLNMSGRFEALAVVFPTDFAQAKFVLSALEQWRFRPARQNGKLIAVEVLLIIPEED